ncbi:hypothetical protein SASPL_105055 [Salvia splendens]|uniref:BED-type domain-containing protein n=1 Tax=Salvia splendens TaxID=180675 RepID=A0A8X8YNV1_SALSN|nr:hypothetical protein SASPL_105055 [Salvia splendens]
MAPPASKKRKHVVRSGIWKKFDKVFEDSIEKGKCKLCGTCIAADSKHNGTSAMWKHHASCLKKNEAEKNQTPLSEDELRQDIQERGRYALCRMIVLDEKPFRFVERERFHLFCRDMLLNFNIPSRYTIRSDCVKMFLEERELLKVVFSRPDMSRGIPNSTLRTANTILILPSLFSSRLTTASTLSRRRCCASPELGGLTPSVLGEPESPLPSSFGVWPAASLPRLSGSCESIPCSSLPRGLRGCTLWADYLRCVAHILNLVIEDSMKQMGMVVVRVREAVKCIKGSTARSKAFKDIAKVGYIAVQQWHPQFGRNLRNLKHNDLTVGVPGEEDWIEVRKLEDDEDAEVRYMAKKMMEKLGKYWLEEYELNPNMNKILYIAAMLDPRQKMKHVEFCLKKLYGDARANELVEELRKPTDRHFLGKSYCNILCVASEGDDDKDDSSELTRYFAEKQYKASEHEHFNILIWWKTYGISFPILSEMAKDILAIPISSIISESAFSMGGGRVLSTFRNSLAPEMVEALICSEDRLRSSSSSADLMEEEGEPIPFLRKQYYEMVEALHKDGKVMWPLDGTDLGELERTHSSDHDES